MGEPENYRLIIDCLLNVPLLYWASQETGDESYRQIADRHVHTTLENVDPPGLFDLAYIFFDPVTGNPDHGATCQGYRTVLPGREARRGEFTERHSHTAIQKERNTNIFSVVSVNII